MKRLLIVTTMLVGGFTAASAQNPNVLQQQAPNMPPLQQLPPEKVEPQDPSTTGSTDNLSEKLEKSDGVIRPPQTGASDMVVPAPDTGTTPIIPPPGSPGPNPGADPK